MGNLHLLNVRSSLWQHVRHRHKVSWEDYIEEHGDPTTEVCRSYIVMFCSNLLLSSEMQFLDDLAMQALRREDEAREEQCKASPQSEA